MHCALPHAVCHAYVRTDASGSNAQASLQFGMDTAHSRPRLVHKWTTSLSVVFQGSEE